MKVALCYSGLVRNFFDCIDSHKKFIIDKLNPDIFIHTWSKIGSNKIPQWYNTGYNIDRHIQEIKSQENLDRDQIIQLYNPKNISIEYPNIQHFYDKFYCDNKPTFFNNVMMHYGIYSANNLKSIYENQNNFKYDIVIRCRFDLFFENIIFDDNSLAGDINENIIYLPPNENIDSPFTENMKNMLKEQGIKYMPNDQFAYGSSASMDYYSSVYSIYENNYDYYFKHPEGVLTQHLWDKNHTIFSQIEINESIKMRIQSRYWR